MYLFFWISLFPLLLFGTPHWEGKSEEEALFFRRIVDFWQEGEYAIAKSQMEEFLSTFPESSFSDLLNASLGDLFLREKNYTEALDYYASLRSSALWEKVFFNRMHCLYQMQWYATLADECEQFLLSQTRDPKEVEQATYYLAIALYQQCLNMPNDSEQLPALAQRAQPYFASLLEKQFSKELTEGLAYLCCILKEYEKAADLYLDLAKRDPSMEESMLFQRALIQAEYAKELSCQTFREIAQKGGAQAKEAAYNYLVLNFEMGHHEEILAEREALLQWIGPEQAQMAHLFLGKSFLCQKQYKEACTALYTFVAHASPSESLKTALFSLLEAARGADDLKMLDEALAKIAHHYSSDPELPKGRFLRAQMLKKAEKFKEARTELETLLSDFPETEVGEQALFELTHLHFQAKNWHSCHKSANTFLQRYSDRALTPFVLRYLATASAEIAASDPEARPRLVSALEQIFAKKELFSPQELLDWQLLLAKVDFDLGSYEKASATLQQLLISTEPFAERANAQLLFALCHREDPATFCTLAEEALKEEASLIELSALHQLLFNAYLERTEEEPSLLSQAEEHLFQVFALSGTMQRENLLWLAKTYFEKFQKEESLFLAQRAASLLEAVLQKEEIKEQTVCQLATTYAFLGKRAEEISLLETFLNEKESNEARLLLAKAYRDCGEERQASLLFETIVAQSPNARSKVSAEARLQSILLRKQKFEKEALPPTHPNWTKVLSDLKDLILQKTAANEPLHLEAALEYIDLAAHSPQKRSALLEKTKSQFEESADLLSKDYHQALSQLPFKERVYQNYLQFIDAEILLANAATASQEEGKELHAKAETILLQIIDQKAHPALVVRAKQRLHGNIAQN